MTAKRKAKEGERLCGFDKRPCVKERCMQWVYVRGEDKNTGKEIDFYDCAVRWLPTLLIENAKIGRDVAASAQSLRNEVVKRADCTNHLLGSLLLAANARDARRVNGYSDGGGQLVDGGTEG